MREALTQEPLAAFHFAVTGAVSGPAFADYRIAESWRACVPNTLVALVTGRNQ
jgi:hypothetical protein